jgi:hypothetical protein
LLEPRGMSEQPHEDWCLEVYARGMTVDQRNQLMITICEWLHRREIGVAGDSSDISALVAARQMCDAEIVAVVLSEAHRAYAVPKRNGKHYLTTKDEQR